MPHVIVKLWLGRSDDQKHQVIALAAHADAGRCFDHDQINNPAAEKLASEPGTGLCVGHFSRLLR